ncbi:iron complex transport system substrate-binding protein [Nocardioides cavernae]|uniref:Iron complex transport system substrate-binding protein n=1 Tax=Nocardioides cavernae TaxID=1921566 RepID=A0A7Y9KTB8_9ACTN|nr:ABC transporter substrate-binding protein [Nocardioides cavernae]NYE36673.1 iron complex transport system substrate-binding protein [Nocardioides cavernae]
MRHAPIGTTVVSAAAVLVLSGCAGAPEADRATDTGPEPSSSGNAASLFPVEVTSCGFTTTIEAPPERAVTLNQGATEVALALGVEDQMAGTAYLDDAIPAKWADAYDAVEVLSKEYPTREDLLAVQPDLVYASYGSAFDGKVAGTRAELEESGTSSYLSPFGCEEAADRPDPTFEAVWDEIDAVATAFGVPERSEQLRTDQQALLDELATSGAGADLDVLWFDSGDKTPYVGAGGGGPQLVLDAVGATNVFADLDGGWAEASWERVVAADPDVIVLADAGWSSAEDKIEHLEGDPVLSQLDAVRDGAYVVVPFSESTPGVRLADGAASVSDQLQQLASRQ